MNTLNKLEKKLKVPLMSRQKSWILNYFTALKTTQRYGATWPGTSISSVNLVGNEEYLFGVKFKDEPGYLVIKKRENQRELEMMPYASSKNFNETEFDVLVNVNKTLAELYSGDVTPEDLDLEYDSELNNKDKSNLYHICRAFADSLGDNSGRNYGWSSILN